jgi:formyltetrahydrofolate deformylase
VRTKNQLICQSLKAFQPGNVAEMRRAADAFATMAKDKLGMNVRMALSHEVPRIGVFVSKIPHCLQDIAYRSKRSEIRGNLVCVVSNETELQSFCASLSLPFHHIEANSCEKKGAENAQLDILRMYKVDLIIMARYTQMLSGDFLQSVRVPVINIHHTFLPAFPGGTLSPGSRSRSEADRRNCSLCDCGPG